jgi:hypothetical protein
MELQLPFANEKCLPLKGIGKSFNEKAIDEKREVVLNREVFYLLLVLWFAPPFAFLKVLGAHSELF